MAKFNKEAAGKTSVTNYMGARSFEQSAKEELAFSVVSSFIEDSYYESKDKRINRISELVKKVASKDPLFVAKLAIITRREFHMRSSFHVLLSELARVHRGNSLVKNTVKEGVERVDDLTEIVAYLKKPIPNGIKKGLALALEKFNGYQLAKYRGERKDFSLVDLFNLIHPKTNDAKLQEAWKKLIEGELKNRKTWESKLSAGEKHEEVWDELLDKGELGYMALLRNLRNIVEKAEAGTVNKAIAMIMDKEEVKKSKQLPFRFLSAYEALQPLAAGGGTKKIKFEKDDKSGLANRVLEAIETAVRHSVDNIPLLPGKTMILSDNSGSMTGDRYSGSPISAMSNRKTSDIANLFATLYWLKAENTYVGLFGDRLISPKLDRTKGVFENYKIITEESRNCGGSTEAGIFEAFKNLIKDKEIVDRIVIFSDCQVGDGCQWYGIGHRDVAADFNKLFQQYRKINPNATVYCVDLKGYGNTLFSDGVMCLSGWSDKIFELMQMTEKKDGMVKWIENYPLQLI